MSSKSITTREAAAGTRSGPMGWLSRAFLYWLPLAISITALIGLVYVTVQQGLRQGANDPQIQLAEDGTVRLGSGEQAVDVVGGKQVDMAHSLAPFLIVYDDAGNVVASSGQLNGRTPNLPDGVLSYARQWGENRITWQPQEDARTAAVIRPVGGQRGFVLAGRSLREVEMRESQLMASVVGAWVVGLVGSLAAWALALWVGDRLVGR